MPRFNRKDDHQTPAPSALDLAFQGAIFGAIAGSLFLFVMSLSKVHSLDPKAIVASIIFGTWAGAPLGAVLAMVLGLTLLRRVARFKALAASTVAAAVGAFAGLLFGAACCDIDGGMGSLYAVAGSVVSVIAIAIYLHRTSR